MRRQALSLTGLRLVRLETALEAHPFQKRALRQILKASLKGRGLIPTPTPLSIYLEQSKKTNSGKAAAAPLAAAVVRDIVEVTTFRRRYVVVLGRSSEALFLGKVCFPLQGGGLETRKPIPQRRAAGGCCSSDGPTAAVMSPLLLLLLLLNGGALCVVRRGPWGTYTKT